MQKKRMEAVNYSHHLRQESLIEAEISGPQQDEKQAICTIPKYLMTNTYQLKGRKWLILQWSCPLHQMIPVNVLNNEIQQPHRCYDSLRRTQHPFCAILAQSTSPSSNLMCKHHRNSSGRYSTQQLAWTFRDVKVITYKQELRTCHRWAWTKNSKSVPHEVLDLMHRQKNSICGTTPEMQLSID